MIKIQNNYNLIVVVNYNNNNLGDRSSSIGIAKAIKENILGNNNLNQIVEISIDKKWELEKLILLNTKSIIITSGEYGIKFIDSFTNNKNIILIWSGHQYYQELKTNIINKLSIIILPYYVIDNNLKGECSTHNTKLIGVPGVASDPDNNKLVIEYNKYPFINSEKSSVIVLIGGRAPDKNGSIKEMIDQDILFIAKASVKLAIKQDAFILATNGPRSEPETLKKFESVLNNSYINDSSYMIFDFHQGERVYNALLYRANLGNSQVIVSGESSSIIREFIENTKYQIFVYLTKSMSEAHYKQVGFEWDQGHINIISEDNFFINNNKYLPLKLVKEVIVEEIINNKLISDYSEDKIENHSNNVTLNAELFIENLGIID